MHPASAGSGGVPTLFAWVFALRSAMPGPPYKPVPILPKCSALDALSKEDVRRLYYRTAYSAGVPGRVRGEEEKDENFIDIHGIGQKNTKYMDAFLSKAPMINRSACSHSKTYVPLPLGDNVTNAELARSFKSNVGTNSNACYIPLGCNTQYLEDFPERNHEELEKARQENKAPPPAKTRTIGGTTDLLEVASHEHSKYQVPDQKLAKARKASLPRAGLDIGGSAAFAKTKSNYEDAYGPAAAAAVRAERRQRKLTGSCSAPLLPPRS